MARLYAASRLFVNFFQPSFKLAEKHRDGATVTKRYHAPQTPCERLLLAESIPTAIKDKLRQVTATLDLLRLLEEIRAMQAHLAALSNGAPPPPPTTEPPDLTSFIAGLSSAWRDGEIRPTFSMDGRSQYLRGVQPRSAREIVAASTAETTLARPSGGIAGPPCPEAAKPVYAGVGNARVAALQMAWPIACHRLEEVPNINAMQLFEELCIQFPGRFTRKQYKTFARKVSDWRQRARARGVVIGPKTYRRSSDKSRGRRPDIFRNHWSEMALCLEEKPDQTARELLEEFEIRYPGEYSSRQLHTLQKRVRAWRQQAVRSLIGEISGAIS